MAESKHSRVSRKTLFILMGVLVIATGLWFGRGAIRKQFFKPTGSFVPIGINATNNPDAPESIETYARELEIPWSAVMLPGGDILVTERPGRLRQIGKDAQTYTVSGVQHVGEGGLLGVALHPKFADNSYIYVYLTTKTGDSLTNRVERYKLANKQLSERKVIIEDIPGASNHDGGFLAFGPDGKLYVTTGDANIRPNAQDKTSLAGKILRVNEDGSNPDDNPFGNAVYSYGHRNPQGLAWDASGQLWSTEHGPSGAETGNDELNLIVKGGNYGWPDIKGTQTREGMIAPMLESGSDETWAPGGMAYHDGSLYFAGLRGQTLYEVKLDGGKARLVKAHFRNEYGRLRGVMIGLDNLMYLTTSNRDGRGTVAKGDDKIIRIDPGLFHN